jgi:tetratricopeptide (TPR) repeat protein
MSITALLLLTVSCGDSRYQVDEFEPHIRKNPTEADKDFNEGIALFMVSRWQESADALERAVAKNPGDGDAYFHLGLAYSNLKNNAEAKEAFDKAFSLGDDYGASREQMSEIYRIRGDDESMIKVLEEAILNNDPHPVKHIHQLGVAYYKTGRYDDAISAFSMGIKTSSPSSVIYGSYYCLGLCYVEMKKYGDAINVLNQQIELNPEYSNIIETYFYLGYAYNCIGEYGKAILTFEKVLELKPGYPNALYNLATSYWMTGEQEKSRALCEELESIVPELAMQLKRIIYGNTAEKRGLE